MNQALGKLHDGIKMKSYRVDGGRAWHLLGDNFPSTVICTSNLKAWTISVHKCGSTFWLHDKLCTADLGVEFSKLWRSYNYLE